MVLTNEEQLNMINFRLKEKETAEFDRKLKELDTKQLNELKKQMADTIKEAEKEA